MALNKIKVNDTTTVNTGVVYDITKATGQSYTDLKAALGTDGNNVPPEVREGGMSIRFVQTSDNKYVQYRLMSDSFNTTVANWQGEDEEPINGSKNFVQSNGIYNKVYTYSDKQSTATSKKIRNFSHNGSDVSNYNYRYYVYDVTGFSFVKINTSLIGQGVHLWEGFHNDSYVKSSKTVSTTTLEEYEDIVDVRDFTVLKINVYHTNSHPDFPQMFVAIISSRKVQTELSELMDTIDNISINKHIETNANILPPAQETGYWDESGNKIDEPNYNRTPVLLELDALKTGKFALRQRGTLQMFWISLFNADGTFHSQIVQNSEYSANIDIPDTVKYFTISAVNKDLKDICVSYSSLSEFVEYQSEDKISNGAESVQTKNAINLLNEVTSEEPSGWNILPPAQTIGYWDNSNNGEYVYNKRYKCTPDFVLLNFKGTLSYKNGYSLNDYLMVCVLYFNANKEYLGYTNTAYAQANFIIPSGSAYIKVWIAPVAGGFATPQNINLSYISLSYYSYRWFDFYVGNKIVLPSRIYSSFYGKNIVNFGDSIFAYGWDCKYDISTYLAKLTGANVINCAFGGTRASGNVASAGYYGAFSMNCIADSIHANNWSVQDAAVEHIPDFVDKLAALKLVNWDKVDIATIAFGTNDFTANVHLDNGDAVNIDYYADALRYSLEKLWTRFYNIRIFLLTPTFRCWENGTIGSNTKENTNGDKLTDFVAKMKEVGSEYNLDVIDDYNIGINLKNVASYIPVADGTHHNVNGKKVIAANIANKLY